MNKKLIYKDLNIIDYKEAWDFQVSLFEKLLQNKIEKKENPNYLLFCEHPHVYTLGKHGKKENLLLSEAAIKKQNIAFYPINRGGDITYHGFGQLLVYPILDLENFKIGLREYIFLLEETVIQFLSDFDIKSFRLKNAAGVWIDSKHKICAIGVKASRMITMHGLALNINTDLKYFDFINPCGFKDKKATSMQKILSKEISMDFVKNKFREKFVSLFEAFD